MIYSLNIGGVEKSLLNMIEELVKYNYEITILMLEESGDLLKSVSNGILIETVNDYGNIHRILSTSPKKLSSDLLAKGKVLQAFMIIFIRLISKVFRNNIIYYNFVLRNYPMLEKEYDLAIAYAGPMDFISYFVVNKIRAVRKVQWIHSDITKMKIDKGFTSRIYRKFDKLYAVSKEAREKLIEFIPSVHNKTELFLNLMSYDEIYSKSRDTKGFTDDFDGIRILTIGRLSGEKGQDLTIPILSRLKSDGYNVKWYCIGEGNARKEYERLIVKYGVQNSYILLGSKSNPYPYLDQCDLYVQPSRYEGYCLSLAEAKLLNKPIVTANFVGAKEQIKDGENGLIVNFNEQELYLAIKKLIINENLCSEFTLNLEKAKKNETNQVKTFLDYVG